MFVINQCCDRIPAEVVEGWRGIGVANIGDARGRSGCMSHRMKPVTPAMRLLGTALTVQTSRADNLALHVALNMARPGDVLVVDAGGVYDTGVWGSLMTRMAIKKGLGGIVLDGAIRDSQELAGLGFPVFSAAIAPQGGFKASPGSVNVPVSCSGVPVAPGDLVAGDADGVVVVPAARAEEILARARAVQEKERELEERIMNGEALFDLLKLGEAMSVFKS